MGVQLECVMIIDSYGARHVEMKPRLNPIARCMCWKCVLNRHFASTFRGISHPAEMVEPAHNECVMCGTHIPDNEGACWRCVKAAKRVERQFMFDVFGDKHNLAGALDTVHDQRNDRNVRYWPNE